MSDEKETEETQVGEKKKKRKNSTFSFEYGDFTYDLLSLKHLDRSVFNVSYAYEEAALRAMEEHYAFYGQAAKIEGYVTRNAVIHCSCGNRDIRLDTCKDHGVIAANGEPVLTCNVCHEDISIYRFGLCDAEEKYGKLSALRPSGEKEMNEAGIMCYRCMPVLAEKWRQKEGDLLVWDEGSEEFDEALKAGAYLTCRYGGKIEVIQTSESESDEKSDGIFHCTGLVEWLEYIERPYKDEDYLIDEYDRRIAIKPHCAGDKYVTIGYGHAIQSQEDAEKYRFKTYQYSSNDSVKKSIKKQLKEYGEDLSNPAILSFDDAENLLETDLVQYQDKAKEFIEETGLDFTINEMDAVTSTLYNGNKAYDPESFLYYLLKKDKEGAINILHTADENEWYTGREGTLRRRLMEYNIFFNGNYDFYEVIAFDELKRDVGW